jgi:hypothetical protein
MKENPNIEELLNGFIDGELSERQRIEVQRLISHDAKVAKRLRELQECKMLVGSLPRAEAPSWMMGRIRASLERGTLRAEPRSVVEQRQGRRHLLARKVLTAAAMIGLAAVLGAVVYTIVAPGGGAGEPGLIVKQWPQPGKVVATEPAPFYGRVEFKTTNLVAVDAKINRAFEDNGLVDFVSRSGEAGKSVYTLSCGREGLRLLLADLEDVWGRFDSATLFVETEQFGREVAVRAVTPEQIEEIVSGANFEERIKTAKDFAVSNSIAEIMPGKEVWAAIDAGSRESISIPKPVLTSPEKPAEKRIPETGGKEQVHLTIVLAGGE